MGNEIGVLRDVELSIEGTDYGATVRKVILVPETNIVTYPTLVPSGTKQYVDNPVYALELQGAQDYTTTGLTKYLRDHHGENATVVFTPKQEEGQETATCEVVCIAQPFGGEQGAVAEFDTSLPVVGIPDFDAWDAGS